MRKTVLLLLAAFLLAAGPAGYAPAEEAEKWQGTDVIIEEVLARYGARARQPFINTDQGDLILFVFAVGGLAAGFVLGYHGRRLFVEMEGLKKGEHGHSA